METVLITGGSGMIGTHLTELLLKEGFEVVHLTRHKNSKSSVKTFVWDVKNDFLEEGALDNVSYIIHLAGASIAGARWTEERKRTIIESRTKTAELLYKKAKEKNCRLKAFISASGINYYGTETTDKIFTEDDEAGEGFASCCVEEWEKAVSKFEDICRVVKFRCGIVLEINGGALQKMYGPVKWGIGSPLGTGKQWIPWIHIEDVCHLYMYAIKNNISGVFNAVAPDHVTNNTFVRLLGKISGHWIIMPNVPSFILRMLYGKMADLVLKGSRASGEKIMKTGFEFRYPDLESALRSFKY